MINSKKTERGFRVDEFEDIYGKVCSLQKSSSSLGDCIWLGINDPDPIIKAYDAAKMGRTDLLTPGEPVVGWVKWPIPDEVQVPTRMHLNQEQVKALLPALMHFAETGNLP